MTRLRYLVHGTLLVIVVLAALACAREARADAHCTFTITNMNFGTIDLTANTTFDATATLNGSCNGGGQGDKVRICPNINAGSGGTTTGNPRFLKSGSNTLNFNLFQDAGRTTVWGSFLWSFGAFTAPTLTLTLGSGGSASLPATTIFGRISAGQQTLPPGTYTSSFSGNNVQIAYDTSTDSCSNIGNNNATSAPFTVTATYPATCAVSATALNFGSTSTLGSNVDASNTLTTTCSATTPYNIGLNAGTGTGATVAARKMTSGANTITYSLFTTTGRTTVWGNTVGTDTVSATGSGLGQSSTIFGRVPTQTTPAPATYADTIIATITY